MREIDLAAGFPGRMHCGRRTWCRLRLCVYVAYPGQRSCKTVVEQHVGSVVAALDVVDRRSGVREGDQVVALAHP